MSFDVFMALVAFALVSSLTPGPNNLMLLSSGVNFGFERTVPHIVGVSLGFVSLLLAVGAGLGAVLQTIPGAFVAIKIAGGAYLVFLAWKVANASAPEAASIGHRPLGFIAAWAFQWVNPKGWIMAVTAMATYTDPDRYWPTMVLVALAFGIVALPSAPIWTGLGTVLRNWLQHDGRRRWFNWTMAGLLIASLWPMLH